MIAEPVRLVGGPGDGKVVHGAYGPYLRVDTSDLESLSLGSDPVRRVHTYEPMGFADGTGFADEEGNSIWRYAGWTPCREDQ